MPVENWEIVDPRAVVIFEKSLERSIKQRTRRNQAKIARKSTEQISQSVISNAIEVERLKITQKVLSGPRNV